MAAYFVAEVEITNPAGFQPYGAAVGATLEQYGGRFLTPGRPDRTDRRWTGTEAGRIFGRVEAGIRRHQARRAPQFCFMGFDRGNQGSAEPPRRRLVRRQPAVGDEDCTLEILREEVSAEPKCAALSPRAWPRLVVRAMPCLTCHSGSASPDNSRGTSEVIFITGNCREELVDT
jgi:hypothetical protein